MRAAESISVPQARVPAEGTCTLLPVRGGVDLHTILGRVETMHKRGAAKWLTRVTKCSMRTARYWLSRTYEPKGEDALKIARQLKLELDAARAQVEQFELQF